MPVTPYPLVPVILAEIIMDSCTREYGDLPCHATNTAATNHLLASEAIGDTNPGTGLSWWNFASGHTLFSANVAIAPDSAPTADLVYYAGGGGATVLVGASRTASSVSTGVRHVLSMYFKVNPAVAGARWVLLASSFGQSLWVNIATGAVGSTSLPSGDYGVVDAGGGWYRVWFVRAPGGTSLTLDFRWVDANLSNYGNALAIGEGHYAWGGMVTEEADWGTALYIPTYDAKVTLQPTGSQKCFKTFATCQDLAAYEAQPKVYRFANQRLDWLQAPGEAPTMPTLISADLAPSQLTPRDGLGSRASVSIRIQDCPFSDVGVDPYRAERGTDWTKRSTFWRRWLARNPNWENRLLKITTGFLDEFGRLDFDSLRVRTYLIQGINYPDSASNTIEIVGKDPLRLASSDRATWPTQSFIRLTADCTNVATTIMVRDPDAIISRGRLAGQEYILVDSEIMKVTAATAVTAVEWSLTVTRATIPSFYPAPQFNVAAAHKQEVIVQPCWLFNDQTVPQVIYTLLSAGAGISDTFLPLADWESEMAAGGVSSIRFSALIAKPVGLTDLLSEITRHDINIWWDERASLVRVRPLRLFPPTIAEWNDFQHIVAESVSISASASSRISQAWVYFGHQWPLAEMEKLESFATGRAQIDKNGEDAASYGSPAVQQTFSRFLPNTPANVAEGDRMAARTLQRYRFGMERMSVSVDYGQGVAWTADTVDITTLQRVDLNGNPRPARALVLEAQEQWDAAGVRMTYICEAPPPIQAAVANRVATYGPDFVSQVDYNLATSEEKATYCFIAADDGLFPSDQKSAYILTD